MTQPFVSTSLLNVPTTQTHFVWLHPSNVYRGWVTWAARIPVNFSDVTRYYSIGETSLQHWLVVSPLAYVWLAKGKAVIWHNGTMYIHTISTLNLTYPAKSYSCASLKFSHLLDCYYCDCWRNRKYWRLPYNEQSWIEHTCSLRGPWRPLMILGAC